MTNEGREPVPRDRSEGELRAKRIGGTGLSHQGAEAILEALARALPPTDPNLQQLAAAWSGSGSGAGAMDSGPEEEGALPDSKRVEEQLRKAEARYRTLVEQIPAVTFMAALDDDAHELYVSPQIESLLGFTQQEWLEDPFLWYRQLHPDDRQHWQDEFARTCATGVQFRSEYRLLARDGRVVWVHGEAQLVRDDAGRPLFIQGIAFDITERKRAEEERVAKIRAEAARAEAEAANRAKDHFLAILGHELRNPLNPVLLATSTALDDPETPPEMRPLLAMILRNVQLESRLIDDLLDMTRIIQGKLSLRPERLDAHALIEQTLEICRENPLSDDRVVTIELAAARSQIKADPARLQQILWNLIKNAMKFTPDGGRIAIRTRNEPAQGHGPDRLIIEVSDSGIGIAPEVLSRIFKPFEQGGASVTQRFQGLGLGLAISRSLAEAHGGRLSADSAGAGRGATFTLDLATVPATAPGSPDAAPSPQASQPPPVPLRLLVVEDNADSLRVLARLLRQRGYLVTAAGGINAALEAAAKEKFDLLISDLGLPDGSGLDLMRQLGRRTRVRGIALSGYGLDEDYRKSREAGFVAHLTKPVEFATLLATIQRISSEIPPADQRNRP